MDLSTQPQRIRSFYLRTAQMIRKVCKNKSTIKTEAYRSSAPNRYLALLHKVVLNYQILNELASELKISKDTALGSVLIYELMAGNLTDEEWQGRIKECLNGRELKMPVIKTHVRLNTLKTDKSILDGYAVSETSIPYVYESMKNDSKNSLKSVFDDDKLLACLKFQSFPSCLPAYLLNPHEGSTVLDCTAAPGNKTTHLSSIMNGTGHIIAFDRDKQRIKLLKNTIEEYGATNVEIIHKDFLKVKPDEFKADYILVDPSCSGSGIHLNYKKDQKRIDTLSRFQAMLLGHALKFKPRRLVYSTCSVHQEEGEEVMKEALEKYPEYEIEPVGEFWKERGHPGYPFSAMVARSGNEEGDKGFFVAVLRKKDE